MSSSCLQRIFVAISHKCQTFRLTFNKQTLKMSGVFKNAKKKVSQTELRKFMSEHKSKLNVSAKKIESPLAKYNELGQLTCVLCKSVVRSEAVWNVHINAKQHKENVELAKKLKERTNNFSQPLKRPLTPPMVVPTKKVKGILKNAKPLPEKLLENVETNATEPTKELDKNGLPSDFFDNKNAKPIIKPGKAKEEKMEVEESKDESALPEGFFDDPKLDAKARHIEYKDPVEEEWERFQKEIREANNESAAIIAEDQEEATTERQIDDIDEQMRNWTRVVNLEKKKVEIMQSTSKENGKMDMEDSDSDVPEDFDEFLDWRSKKGF